MTLQPDTQTDPDAPTAVDPPGAPGDLPPALALLRERLMSPAQAARHPALRSADGKPAHVATVYRLFSTGARAADGSRVTLERVKCPAGWRTSLEAIERFDWRLTTGAGPAAPAPTTAAERRRRRAVDDALDRAGIG